VGLRPGRSSVRAASRLPAPWVTRQGSFLFFFSTPLSHAHLIIGLEHSQLSYLGSALPGTGYCVEEACAVKRLWSANNQTTGRGEAKQPWKSKSRAPANRKDTDGGQAHRFTVWNYANGLRGASLGPNPPLPPDRDPGAPRISAGCPAAAPVPLIAICKPPPGQGGPSGIHTRGVTDRLTDRQSVSQSVCAGQKHPTSAVYPLHVAPARGLVLFCVCSCFFFFFFFFLFARFFDTNHGPLTETGWAFTNTPH
jgi:hypothetical protein